MDKFTRNYSIILGTLTLIGLIFWIHSLWQPKVWELNHLLSADAQLANYPYQFRVRSLNNGIAVISTPRSFDVPTMQFLAIIYPALATKAQDDPLLIAAQQELIYYQKRAMELITTQPGVTQVDWELDTRWLADHGVQPEQTKFK